MCVCVYVRLVLQAVALALAFVGLCAGGRGLGHGGRFPLAQLLALTLHLLTLRVQALLLPVAMETQKVGHEVGIWGF